MGTGADGRPVGRATLVVDDPAGPMEAWLSALWMADEPDVAAGTVARALVEGMVAAASDLRVPRDARVNAETHADPAAHRALLEAAGVRAVPGEGRGDLDR